MTANREMRRFHVHLCARFGCLRSEKKITEKPPTSQHKIHIMASCMPHKKIRQDSRMESATRRRHTHTYKMKRPKRNCKQNWSGTRFLGRHSNNNYDHEKQIVRFFHLLLFSGLLCSLSHRIASAAASAAMTAVCAIRYRYLTWRRCYCCSVCRDTLTTNCTYTICNLYNFFLRVSSHRRRRRHFSFTLLLRPYEY